MTEEIQLNEDEKKVLGEYLEGYGAAVPTDKENIHTFLNKVATSDDTTKTGYLTEDELGISKFSVRSYKSFALLSDKILVNDYFKDYFEKESEIITASSLSKGGFLIKAAITTKKELADTTKKQSVNKGWFKRKEKPTDENIS